MRWRWVLPVAPQGQVPVQPLKPTRCASAKRSNSLAVLAVSSSVDLEDPNSRDVASTSACAPWDIGRAKMRTSATTAANVTTSATRPTKADGPSSRRWGGGGGSGTGSGQDGKSDAARLLRTGCPGRRHRGRRRNVGSLFAWGWRLLAKSLGSKPTIVGGLRRHGLGHSCSPLTRYFAGFFLLSLRPAMLWYCQEC